MNDITPVEALYDKSPETLIALLALASVKYLLLASSLKLAVDFEASLVSKSEVKVV